MGERQEVVEQLDVANQAELLLLDRELEERYGRKFERTPGSPWLLAQDAFPEAYRSATEARDRFLGGVAVRGEAETLVTADTNNESTLMSAIQMAALGDRQGRTVVHNNVATDVAERLFKAAHQTRVEMTVVDGKLRQAGRNLTDLHRNALEHTILNSEMLRRTKLELRNALLFEELHRTGALETHDAVVFSPSPTAMSLQEKKDYNFFLDTETCSIQRLTAEGSEVLLESAFVAGKQTPESERHDIAAIQSLAAQQGVKMVTEDGTDIIGHIFLIPKGEIQGIEDVVERYDDAAGGTFYGEAKPRKDYRTYAVECEERSGSFSSMVEAIASQLISEAHTFRTAIDANLRLDELSEQYAVKRAVHDNSINEAVFGKEAAMHIQEARFFMDRGEFDRAESSLAMAQATADSGSCPWLKDMLRGGNDANDPSGASGTVELADKKRGHCPYCGITVFVDPCAKRISCWDCSALVVDGKIISKGNGGSNKRRAQEVEGVSKIPEPPIASEKEPAPEPPSMAQQVDAAFADRGVETFDEESRRARLQPESSSQQHAGKLALAGAAA